MAIWLKIETRRQDKIQVIELTREHFKVVYVGGVLDGIKINKRVSLALAAGWETRLRVAATGGGPSLILSWPSPPQQRRVGLHSGLAHLPPLHIIV
jgi:hypothetical protein